MAIVTKQKATAPGIGDTGASSEYTPRKRGDFVRWFSRRIKPQEVTFFTSQLSLMLEVGTSLALALRPIADQITTPAFRQVVMTMLRDIEEGKQLSDAMEQHPRVFSSVFVSMVRAGETGGFLKMILDRIVAMQEKRYALITQIRSALTYPVVLSVMALGVIIFVVVGILPKFEVLFAGKESILPATTRFLMTLSASMRGYWWAYIVAAVGIALGLKFWKESKPGQALADRFFVSAPLVARLSNKIYTAQFLRTVGNLMESRVPLLEALDVSRTTFGNRHFRYFIDSIRDHVEQGGRFSDPFADYPYIMASVKQMVATGEDAGNLPRVMLRLADYYDNEVDRELKIVSSMIEPLALVFMGTVVGIIVSSVILPIFKMAHAIH
ncbi:type II secretion system F family protein [Thermodesulfobacteriota bacterium]